MRRINVRLGAHIERAKVSGSESRQRPQLEKGFFDRRSNCYQDTISPLSTSPQHSTLQDVFVAISMEC